jgi:hypothetical protein
VRHTGEQVADEWAQKSKTLKFTVVGGTFDNTATNKKAWRILSTLFPSKFFQGCTAHAWNLLVKWIFNGHSAIEGGVEDETRYPFQELKQFVIDLK